MGNPADPSLPSGDELKNAWSSNLTRPYAIAACARTILEGGKFTSRDTVNDYELAFTNNKTRRLYMVQKIMWPTAQYA